MAGAEEPGRPIHVGIKGGHRTKQWLANRVRQKAAHEFFSRVKAIAAIAGEELVAAVAGKRHGDRFARELHQETRRQCRTVTERFVEDARKSFHETALASVHPFDNVMG